MLFTSIFKNDQAKLNFCSYMLPSWNHLFIGNDSGQRKLICDSIIDTLSHNKFSIAHANNMKMNKIIFGQKERSEIVDLCETLGIIKIDLSKDQIPLNIFKYSLDHSPLNTKRVQELFIQKWGFLYEHSEDLGGRTVDWKESAHKKLQKTKSHISYEDFFSYFNYSNTDPSSSHVSALSRIFQIYFNKFNLPVPGAIREDILEFYNQEDKELSLESFFNFMKHHEDQNLSKKYMNLLEKWKSDDSYTSLNAKENAFLQKEQNFYFFNVKNDSYHNCVFEMFSVNETPSICYFDDYIYEDNYLFNQTLRGARLNGQSMIVSIDNLLYEKMDLFCHSNDKVSFISSMSAYVISHPSDDINEDNMKMIYHEASISLTFGELINTSAPLVSLIYKENTHMLMTQCNSSEVSEDDKRFISEMYGAGSVYEQGLLDLYDSKYIFKLFCINK